MAEGLARSMFNNDFDIRSGGSILSGEIYPSAIKAMDDTGIDIRDQYFKSADDLDKDFINNLDYAITLCSKDFCLALPSKPKNIHWMNKDSAKKDHSNKQLQKSFEITRNNIFGLIKKFIIEKT
tara:strand:+ start:135 stop:506 length:372 start_codon:yes stop_codon:yes gene_type:complete